MDNHRTGRRRLGAIIGCIAVACTLGLTAANTQHAAATAPQGYAASDVLGQTDTSGNPVFTTSAVNNGSASPRANGLSYPQGTALDTTGHQLFAGDCDNNRILVFNLDANNNLLSRTADFVIGQPNFTTRATPVTQSGLRCPVDPAYDAVHKHLWVADDQNNRVLEFDLSGGVTNGMNASHVLGQADFTTRSCAGATVASICQPYGGTIYDAIHDRLFVSDGDNRRVLEWDLAGGITDGMNATHVLGKPNFTTTSCTTQTQSSIGYPYGMAYDATRQLLYVADDDSNCGGNTARVMVWDLSGGIADGMNAAHILGKSSFTSPGFNTDVKAAVDDPEDLSLDPVRQHLFVQDDNRNRVLMFDVATITNGEEATAVLGQPDFATTGTSYSNCVSLATQYNQCDAEGQSQDFDVVNNRYYLSDSSYNRVLIFNFVRIVNDVASTATAGVGYSSGVQVKNFQGTVHFTVSGGSLPPGLTLDASSGVVSGTPSIAGRYSFTVTATDDNGLIGSFTDVRAESITVGGVPVPASGGAAG